jgi:hypothetical protein
MANGGNAAKARGQRSPEQKSAEQGEQHVQQGTERQVRGNVTFVSPLEMPWGMKPQQPDRFESAATLNLNCQVLQVVPGVGMSTRTWRP